MSKKEDRIEDKRKFESLLGRTEEKNLENITLCKLKGISQESSNAYTVEVQHIDKRKVKDKCFTLAARFKRKVIKLRKAG